MTQSLGSKDISLADAKSMTLKAMNGESITDWGDLAVVSFRGYELAKEVEKR